jgi:hypothetical protein
MAFGDIELDNTEGNLDDWLADIWTNREVRMYVGDNRWERADFRLVFDGVTSDLGSRSRDLLNLTVRDKLQRLNTAVSDTKLGGSGPNADRLLPVCLGEAHNVAPLLIDQALLKYQVHNGPIERIIEVRDNGIVVAHTADLEAGTFTLSASPAGLITASVQGAKTEDGVYVNTAAQLVQMLATGYGTDLFSAADLDADNLVDFDAANPQPVGVYLSERENVLAVCQQIAASVGAQVVMSPAGTLRLIKLDVPVSGTEVTTASMAERSLRVSQRVPVVASVKLGYCKNWTVQNSLQTGIPAEHRDLFAQEWLTATAADADIAMAYKLAQEPQQQNTMLLVKEDAEAETARRLALWGDPRTVFSYEGMPELLLEELGAFQTVTHDRFGLSEGVDVQIVGVERDWLAARAGFSVISGGRVAGSTSSVGGGGGGGGGEEATIELINPSFELGTYGWTGTLSVIGDTSFGEPPQHGSAQGWAGSNSYSGFWQDISLPPEWYADIDAATATLSNVSAYHLTYASQSDTGRLFVAFIDGVGATIGSAFSGFASDDTWTLHTVDPTAIPATTRVIRIGTENIRIDGTHNDNYWDNFSQPVVDLGA